MRRKESRPDMGSTERCMRQLGYLRARMIKCTSRGKADETPLGQVAEEALALCGSMVHELAGQNIECDRLRKQARAEGAAWERLFAIMPTPCVMTDGNATILDANRAAGLLLNLGPKRLKDRALMLFSEDRGAFAELIHQLTNERTVVNGGVVFRPRERRPVCVTVMAVPVTPDGDLDLALWFLIPSDTVEGQSIPSRALAPMPNEEPWAPSESHDDDLSTCRRCGGGTINGHHDSTADCAESLDHEMRSLHTRLRLLQARHFEMTRAQATQLPPAEQGITMSPEQTRISPAAF